MAQGGMAPAPLVLPADFACKVSKAFIEEMATVMSENARVPEDLRRVPKRLRKLEEAYERNETQKMKRLEVESALEEKSSAPAPSSRSVGKLSTGQSVHHWWASWFKTATEPVMQIRKGQRPNWYDASIVTALGVKRVQYAGRWFEEHTYQVH